MAKYLDKVIKEMNNYGEMGLPDGTGSMGMGSVSPMALRGGNQGKAIKAYKLNDVLRHKNQAEEEEGLNDTEGMNDYESDDMDNNTEELKQFFIDNPEPADEEIAAYAEEKGIDLQQLRKDVYALIQSLLQDDEDNMDDYESDDEPTDDFDNDNDIDFSVTSDTGERPATNEINGKPRF